MIDHNFYHDIISLNNLYYAWGEFVRGKKYKKDVTEFALNLSGNIIKLHHELMAKSYIHGHYKQFSISDPKPRIIHKALVRDRLLHHAIYRILYIHFERRFIYDSYSCRIAKGTHRALNRFKHFTNKVSESNSRTCWVLKCDVRKFFASIDQSILLKIFSRHILDLDTNWLIGRVVKSFNSGKEGEGLPLGNLTSQLLVNVYMNEFDQFVKHKLKVRYYVRYADDFVVMSHDREELLKLLPLINQFLKQELKLDLHPQKVSIETLTSGIDFLGWVHFPDHRVLRTTTKKRMWQGLRQSGGKEEVVQSYLGFLSHGNAYKLQQEVKNLILQMVQ